MQLNAICFMCILVYITAYKQFCYCLNSNLTWPLKQNQMRRHIFYIYRRCRLSFLFPASIVSSYRQHQMHICWTFKDVRTGISQLTGKEIAQYDERWQPGIEDGDPRL